MAAQAEPIVAEQKSRSRKVDPPTFADIARKKMRERVEAYRSLLTRHAKGDPLTEADLSEVADLLELLGLPDYAWGRDTEAMQRFAVVEAKHRAAVDAAPAHQQRSVELARDVESLQAKLAVAREKLRRAQAGANKSEAYSRSLAQLASEHPHAIGPIETAVSLRLGELNRRKRGAMS